jgi:precorrin-6B methylase 1
MKDPMHLDPRVTDAINTAQQATMSPQVVLTETRGMACHAVAQSAAIAVQDAADALRNMSGIAATASGVALSQYLATGDPHFLEVLTQARAMMDKAIEDFSAVGAAAARLVKEFPSG